MVLLPFTIAICLLQHVYYTISALIYVDACTVGSNKAPKNTKKNWLVRGLLVCGILASLSFGYGAFQILDMMDLAHVKQIEYLVIVVPVQINLGMLMGSGMQYKMEKRLAARVQRELQAAKADVSVGVDEKEALLEV